MKVWTVGGPINRRLSQIARIDPNHPLGSLSSLIQQDESANEGIRHLVAQGGSIRDPKIFLYSIEAYSARFSFRIWLGWFGIMIWRKWEDWTLMPDDHGFPLFSGITLTWGRTRNVQEGSKLSEREKTWRWKS